MSVAATYEGFQIKIAQILGSGQRLYQVEGIEDALYGRATQTTIQESKEIIEKYLGTFVEVPNTIIEMSQEMFDQLQQGTLAIQENVRLKSILEAEADRLAAFKTTLEGQYSNLQGIQTQVSDVRDKVPDITETVKTGLEGIQDTVTAGLEPIKDATKRIETLTLEAQTIKDKFADMSGTLDTIRENMKATVEAYEKALAAKGAVGWMKNIPIYVGAAVAVVIGVKVLDVVK